MSSVIKMVPGLCPDVYRPDVMVMLMFPEIYTLTKNQCIRLKSTAKPVTPEHIIKAFRCAIGSVEDGLERPLTDQERYEFVSGLWRRLDQILYKCYIETADPKATQQLMLKWLCYEQSAQG